MKNSHLTVVLESESGMPLRIYTSNRMENLVGALAGTLAEPLASPFTPELIVVQSKGMQRWLAMELAGRLGIWANCCYPFPNRMVWQLFGQTLPDVPDASLYSAGVMTWKIMGLLPGYLERPEFAPLRHYLAGDHDGLKRLQLSARIADTFDQYTLYRPDMLLEWEDGGEGEWQGTLWRALASHGTGRHRARLKRDFTHMLADPTPGVPNLPERITVFGISYLPRYHMDILASVADHAEVNLFLLSPCREYWGDIVSGRDIARRSPEERPYLEEGNPLLASLGTLARDFSNMVIDGANGTVDDQDRYADPGDGTLLTAIQSDILNLRGGAGGGERRPIAAADLSVQLHSCHSPMREMEVLHDNLLALLEREKGLAPRDIVVMTPDIETYAPYISMVFEGEQDPEKKIPYSIADRTLASAGEVAGVFLKLLGLPGSRLDVATVFDILEALPVRRRFGLEARELETVRGWLVATRTRWGIDEGHRAGLGLPAYRENSWAAGLDRLLLGYAMPEEGGQLFNGMLPFDELEGESARTLGLFADFVGQVTGLARNLAGKRTLDAWQAALRGILADFVAADDAWAFELAAVAAVVDAMGDVGLQAAFSEEVELPLIRSWFISRLGEEEKGHGFMTGGVTFCAMLPMRSIPFRVVALVGMNDNVFPRQSRPPGFDLMAAHPLPGDRSLRDEDRYLFLECILSARQYLYVSYVGQSIRDNSTIPPSVLVSEFLDAVDRGFSAGEGMTAAERLVTRHRLQAFSRGYFDGTPGLFSYSDDNCTALLEAAAGRERAARFMTIPLSEPPAEMREIALSQLLRFFVNPARYLLENRLQIRLEEAAVPLEGREPFEIVGLDAYALRQEVLEKRLHGEDPRDVLAIARCRGILPPARQGEMLFDAAVTETDRLVAGITAETAGRRPLEPWHVDVTLRGFRLFGVLDGFWPERRITYRCARLKAKDEIRAWIEHLVLNAFAPPGYPRESRLLMGDATVTFRPADNAADLLGCLLDRYWQGLHLPLRFFPATSLEYALTSGDTAKARKKWESAHRYRGEEEDPFFRLCFGRDEDPLADEFGPLALELFGPMKDHRKKDAA